MKRKAYDEALRETLRACERDLDPALARRLQEARSDALARATRRSAAPFAWGAGLAAAALVLVLLVRLLVSPTPPVAETPEDFVMLLEEDPELYVDLDFYEWVTAQEDAG